MDLFYRSHYSGRDDISLAERDLDRLGPAIAVFANGVLDGVVQVGLHVLGQIGDVKEQVGEPSSGTMKPNPLASLKNFTLPFCRCVHVACFLLC
jgi:hypothetical protein